MTDAQRMQRVIDEHEIFRVRRRWVYARDQGDWDALKTCFHPNATVLVSWFQGSALDFVERTKQTAVTRRPEERSQHTLGNYGVTIHGNRAILEADMQVHSRDYLDGILFDSICFGRFYDFFEKRAGEWRIASWTCIYDKDRLDPVFSAAVPDSSYKGLTFEGPENGFAFMRWRQEKKGRTVPEGLVMGGSEAERQLKLEGAAWLTGN